jgi:acyl carrier protein
VGANVDRLPDVARAVAAAGHAIGNHSYAHPLFCFRPPDFIEADLRRAQQTIRAHTGVAPAWFRAPYGVRWFGMGRAQRRLGLTGVMWSAIGHDWKWNSGAVCDHLANRAANGAILCLHDGRELRAKVIAATKRIPVESVTIDSDFVQLGIDSMDAVEILFALENEFDVSIPDDEVRSVRGIRQMCQGVERLLAAKSAAKAPE